MNEPAQRDRYERAVERARATAQRAAVLLDREAVRKAAEENDLLTVAVICEVFRRLGAFSDGTAAMPLQQVLHVMRVAPQYQKLVRRWVGDLCELGVLREDDGAIRAARLEDPAAHFDAARIRAMASIVVNLITGRQHVLEYVFGPLRPDWFRAYTPEAYDDDPVFRFQHTVVAEFVAALAAQASPEAPLRVLEVGAGTGSLTAQLIPHLAGGSCSYRFTDVTRAFFDDAKKRFRGKEDLITYGVFDINRPPSQNSLQPGAFDLIVAFDVLHCARDLRQTLRWLRELLRPGGALANEQLTRNRAGHLLIPGVMPGFTDFEDDRLSTLRTLLTPLQWRERLLETGFDRFCVLPDDDALLDDLGQAVIFAMAT